MHKKIVILGPTASGKTKLGTKLAYFLNGEIISADSRQVYKYMDIGTGKDLCEYQLKIKNKIINIPYHLIDIRDPKTNFNLAIYQKLVKKIIKKLEKENKVPILVGGTGLYLQAVVDNYNLEKQKNINSEFRKKYEKKNLDEIQKKFQKIQNNFFQKLNNSEKNNKRRLIRYLEILKDNPNWQNNKKNSDRENFLVFGLNPDREIIREKIKKRLKTRLNQGMITEVKNLHKKHKVSWKRLESFGLEYKFIAYLLQKKINEKQMQEKLYIAICQFAKRQMSWFKRWEKQGQKIHWIQNYREVKKIIKQ